MEEPKNIVRAGYDAVSHLYRADDDAPPRYLAWLRELDRRLHGRSRILDLGCGCGVPIARRLADAGHDVVGVDISDVQIERARRLVPGARFVRADAGDLTYDEESLDAIVCLYTLIHLPRHEQPDLIRSFGRWLRPGGLLLATVGVYEVDGGEENWLGGGAPMWWSHPDAETYRRWVRDAGLSIEIDTFEPEGAGGHQLLLATKP